MTHINSLTANAYKANIKPANTCELRQLQAVHEPEPSVHLVHSLCFFLTAPTLFSMMDGLSAQHTQDCISEWFLLPIDASANRSEWLPPSLWKSEQTLVLV